MLLNFVGITDPSAVIVVGRRLGIRRSADARPSVRSEILHVCAGSPLIWRHLHWQYTPIIAKVLSMDFEDHAEPGGGTEPLLSTTEIASQLGIAPVTVRMWLRDGRVPSEKQGRSWRARMSDINELLQREPALGYPRDRAKREQPARREDWSDAPEDVWVGLASTVVGPDDRER